MVEDVWNQSTYVALGYGFATIAFTFTGLRLWWTNRYLARKLRDLEK